MSIGGIFEDITGIDTGDDSRADQARRGQERATAESNATQRYIFDQQRADAQPWRDAGKRALAGLENSDFQRDFSASDFQTDPGYQFRMDEGMKAIQRSAAARGGVATTGTMRSLMRYGQGVAADEYNNAYNRFNGDRDRRFNRLSSLAGFGQTANSQVAQAGQNYANQYGANLMGLANAQGAQAIAQNNQTTGLIQSAISGGMKYSDRRLKTKIEPVSKEELAELKRTLKPYIYRYSNAEHGEGEWIGVMAQDLEKSKLGRALVIEDKNGFKQVDMSKVLSLFLATLAEG